MASQTQAATRKPSMNGHPDTSFVLEPRSVADIELRGKRITIVGGTDGIGRALARMAATKGAEVVVVGRTFRDEGVKGITFMRADLSSMKEAQHVGRVLDPQIDLVVFTTGIMAAKNRQASAEGIELDLAISTLSRLAVLRELAPRLAKRAAATRVFVMGFPGAGNRGDPSDLNAEGPYDAMKQHMNTVAANEALVLDAKERYPNLEVFGLNPGLIKTNIRANFFGPGTFKHKMAELVLGLLTPTADDYAARVLPLFVAPELRGRSGVMFGKKAKPILPSDGLDVAGLIQASETLLGRALS